MAELFYWLFIAMTAGVVAAFLGVIILVFFTDIMED